MELILLITSVLIKKIKNQIRLDILRSRYFFFFTTFTLIHKNILLFDYIIMPFEQTLFIGVVFCLAFGLRSVFGFGGTIFALTILAFFFDMKEVVVLGAFAGMLAAFIILLSDLKSFNAKVFKQILISTLPGLFVGTFLLKNFSSQLIQVIFGVLLVSYSAWTIWSPQFTIPSFLKPILNFVGGIFGGTLGTSGPFFIAAMRETFGDKSNMRSTLSAVFLAIDLLRTPMYFYMDVFTWEKLTPFWWIIFPLYFTVWIGHKIHTTLPERTFQIGISILLGISGISFLFK